ncbi:MAG: DUF423 domain-containing protein [Anaeromyxobacteraceae bacterium]|nr:DUF423 domain-containing protein [Anaeromyxobacteraceae bacterium]
MDRTFFALGAISAALAVLFGSFGAHALRGRLSPEQLAVFETGVRYQLAHALGLLAAAWAVERFGGDAARWGGWLLLTGSVLFSGSLYALTLTGVRWLGLVTPFGGVAFVVGWALLAMAALRR